MTSFVGAVFLFGASPDGLVAGAAATGATFVLDRRANLCLHGGRHLNVIVASLGMLGGLAQHIRLILALDHEVTIYSHIFTREHLAHSCTPLFYWLAVPILVWTLIIAARFGEMSSDYTQELRSQLPHG